MLHSFSPEGTEAVKNAYTPPSAVTDTIAHNRAIIQDVFRLTSPTYVLPAQLFTTVADQQLWRDALIQSRGPGTPPAKNRAPLSSISAWTQPVPVLATSTALDWAHSDSDSWFLKFPASLQPHAQTDAYAMSLRLDLSAQTPPVFAVPMLTDPLLFQE